MFAPLPTFQSTPMPLTYYTVIALGELRCFVRVRVRVLIQFLQNARIGIDRKAGAQPGPTRGNVLQIGSNPLNP